jgi:CheY-like chemotaxis protein
MKNTAPAKILIIDDEERNRTLLEVFVKADGHQVIFACNGEEGVSVAAIERPDLILLDLMMPGMDGFEVTQWLKNHPATRNIAIIVVSALDSAVAQQRMHMSGAEMFLCKPVDRWELTSCISRLLAGRPG